MKRVRSTWSFGLIALLEHGCTETVEHADRLADTSADETPAGGAGSCPIAGCLATLRARQAKCPTADVACTFTEEAEHLNLCYDGEVYAYLTRIDASTTKLDLIGADKRQCYSVDAEKQLIGTVLTVREPDGDLIMRAYELPGGVEYACANGDRLLAWQEHECGEIELFPDIDACQGVSTCAVP